MIGPQFSGEFAKQAAQALGTIGTVVAGTTVSGTTVGAALITAKTAVVTAVGGTVLVAALPYIAVGAGIALLIKEGRKW